MAMSWEAPLIQSPLLEETSLYCSTIYAGVKIYHLGSNDQKVGKTFWSGNLTQITHRGGFVKYFISE
jgi:hypothetical protein